MLTDIESVAEGDGTHTQAGQATAGAQLEPQGGFSHVHRQVAAAPAGFPPRRTWEPSQAAAARSSQDLEPAMLPEALPSTAARQASEEARPRGRLPQLLLTAGLSLEPGPSRSRPAWRRLCMRCAVAATASLAAVAGRAP